MRNEGEPQEQEPRRFTFDELSFLVMNFYDEALVPYSLANYVNNMHDRPAFSGLDSDELEDFKRQYPRYDDDVLKYYKERYEMTRASLASLFGIEVEAMSGLVDAVGEEHIRRKEGDPSKGLVVPRGRTHASFAEGVINMAHLTGETYMVQTGGEGSPFYLVDPYLTLDTLFPRQDENHH